MRLLAPRAAILAGALLAGSLATVEAVSAGEAAAGDRTAKKKPGKEVVEELKRAAAMINAGELDRGIDALEALVAAYPDDPNTKHARTLLADYGTGKEIRVALKDRKVFRESFGIKDQEVLQMAETSLAELRKRFYSRLTPFFEKTSLKLHFFDSQARFREVTGLVTASGVFEPVSMDSKTRTFEGKIVWHLPEAGMNPRDRQLTIQSLLYHEQAHYLTAIHFAGFVPSLINEGISTWIESRLVTSAFVGFRATKRQRIESSARNSLNTILKFDDFVKMLDADRGFGTGGVMVERWYALCYACFDLLAEGAIKDRRRSSCEQVLAALHALCSERARSGSGGEPAERPTNREALEHLVKSCHGATLAEFHKALVAHVGKYRQI